jgi:hypothetical protein
MAIPVRLWGRVAAVILIEALRHPNKDKKIVVDGDRIRVIFDDRPRGQGHAIVI